MSIMHERADTAPPCANPHVDTCPGCVINSEPNALHFTHSTYCVATYLCNDCGHEWSTSWGR